MLDTSHALDNGRSTKGRHESLPALLLASTESVRRWFREDIQVSKALAFKILGTVVTSDILSQWTDTVT